MKRRDLVRHLEAQGCEKLREGGNHTSVSKVALAVSSFALAVMLGGCASKRAMPETGAYTILERYEEDRDGGGSLFKGDSEILSDADIARILGFTLQLTDSNRLAVLKLGTTRYWSEDHAKIDRENLVTFLDRLRSSGRVAYVAQLPRLLVPEKTTVPYLREAAARSQADLLLVYDTAVRTFTKYRAFGKDEARALCSVDAVLLDVRTGIVPFTSRRTEEVMVTKSADDLNFSETTAKAVSAAEGRALQAVAEDTVAFLGSR